jgi:DNA-binding transcriptional ArsR family regulator
VEAALKALAEPRRRAILELVADSEMTAGDIASHFDVSRPAISQHLTVLKGAGLVKERRNGTRRLYSVRPEGMSELREFLDSFWRKGLLRLKDAAEREARLEERKKRGG